MREKIGAWFGEEKSRLAGSAGQMRSLRNQTLCAMLLALTIVLDYFGSIYILPTVKISLSYIGIALTGALLGPVPAMINGALSDVLVWVIKPVGAYFPGYTLSGILGGLIYGVCLYKSRGKGLYIGAAVSKLLVNLFVNVGLNTVWSMIFTGKAYMVLLPARAFKNLVAWPIETILLIVILLCIMRSFGKYRRSGN